MKVKLHPLFKWHLLYWSCYTLFKVYHEFVWIYPKYEELTALNVLGSALVAQTTMLPAKIIFTYWIAYKLLPASVSILKKWGYFVISLAGTVALYRLAVVYITLPIAYKESPESQTIFSLGRISSALYDILLVAGIGTALILLHRQQQAKQREQELEKEKIASELRFLKQQTNPHFLLNTLNNLYALARKKSENTPNAIMQLSHLMRYVLYETSTDNVPISKELEILQHYIDLEQLRYGSRLTTDVSIDTNLNGLSVAPLLLLPLVENAFKHGVSELESKSRIKIELKVVENELHFQVKNSMKLDQDLHQEGIGLKNLRRQLELQYPEHLLETSEKNGVFHASLRINLSCERH